MTEWRDIETDPPPRDGSKLDLWVKWWRADTDTFIGRRVADCYWLEQPHPRWACETAALPINARPTHWMPLPEDPRGWPGCPTDR